MLDGDQIRDAFEIHVYNKLGDRESFVIEPEARPGLTFVAPVPTITLESMTDRRVPLVVTAARADYAGDVPIRVHVRRVGATGDEVVAVGKFVGAR